MVEVRRRRDDEWSDLLAIWRAAVESSHHFLTPDDIDGYERLVADYLPQMDDLRVAEASGRAVGFIAQDTGSVHMLFVMPEHQGEGVGSALLDDVARHEPVLQVGVNEQNPSARAFYQSRGFVEVGRSDVDGHGRPFPLLHLSRLTEPCCTEEDPKKVYQEGAAPGPDARCPGERGESAAGI